MRKGGRDRGRAYQAGGSRAKVGVAARAGEQRGGLPELGSEEGSVLFGSGHSNVLNGYQNISFNMHQAPLGWALCLTLGMQRPVLVVDFWETKSKTQKQGTVIRATTHSIIIY